MTIPIQEEPESTIGRKPPVPPHVPPPPRGDRAEDGATRSGAAVRHEEADESEAGQEIRRREGDEPPTIRGLEE